MSEAQEAVVVTPPKVFKTENDLKVMLATHYQNQIVNFLGDKDRAMRFLSSVMAAVHRKPELLECTPMSVIDSFIKMAQLNLMPSDVSGEAYVLPYDNSKKDGNNWIKVKEAQLQIGYKGWVTLYYRAGVKKIFADIIRANDVYSMSNGDLTHEVDLTKSNKERGEPIGAYARFTMGSGEDVTFYMNKVDILAHGERFSKAWDTAKSPWKVQNDPGLWMWKKTVLMQGGHLIPKSESLVLAMEEDYKDSNLHEERPTFNLEESLKKIGESKDEKELASVWSMLNGEAKADIRLIEAKNQRKKELAPPPVEPPKKPEPPKAEDKKPKEAKTV